MLVFIFVVVLSSLIIYVKFGSMSELKTSLLNWVKEFSRLALRCIDSLAPPTGNVL